MIEKMNEDLKKWISSHPGIKFYINSTKGTISIWKETMGGNITKISNYNLSNEELKKLPFNTVDILNRLYPKFKSHKQSKDVDA